MKRIVFAAFVLSFVCRLSTANTVYSNGSFTVNGASYLRQTLSGGHATGGVFSASRSTVTFVPAMSFTGNTAAGGTGGNAYGGGVYGADSYLKFNLNVVFSTNIARSGDGQGNTNYTAGSAGEAGGGAVYVLGASKVFFNAEAYFANNRADGGSAVDWGGYNDRGGTGGTAIGGAVVFRNAQGGTFEKKTDFYGNAAFAGNGSLGIGDGYGGHAGHAKGGALFLSNTKNVVFNGKVTFSYNSSTGGSGAFGYGGGDNQGDGGSGGNAFGGAVYLEASSFIIFNEAVTMTRNTLKGGKGGGSQSTEGIGVGGNGGHARGGAIYIENKSYIRFNKDAAITYNSVSGGAGGSGFDWGRNGYTGDSIGGGVYVTNHSSIIFAGNVTIRNNNAIIGSALHVTVNSFANFGTGTVDISYNNSSGGNGVIFHDATTTIDLSNVSTLNAFGNVSNNGGFLYISTAAIFRGNVIMGTNSARTNGGSLYVDATSVTFSGTNVVIDYSSAAAGPALYLAGKSVLEFRGAKTEISYNNSTNSDGAIYIDSAATIKFTNTSLKAVGNIANNGGFLYLLSKGTLVFGAAAVINNNIARVNGGGFYLSATNLTFSNTAEISGNTAYSGSAIYADGSSAITFNGANTTISNNKTQNGDGVFYLATAAKVVFNNTNLTAAANSANNGGFLYLSSKGTLTFGGTVDISRNTAKTNGGAFYLNTTHLTFNKNVGLSSNVAVAGSAIYSLGGALSFNGTDTAINFNNSTNGNGIIHLDTAATIKFNNTNLTAVGNLSNNGGFLYLASKGTLTFGGIGTFVKNQARTNGGAFYLNATHLTFSKAVTFSTNTAASGSAIYSVGGAITFNGPDTTINYNNSTNGNGVFYLDTAATVKFNNSTLTAIGNTSNNGGLLYLASKGTLTFGGTAAFIKNLARTNGGAFYLSATHLTFSKAVTFSTNTAAAGSAIYSIGGAIIFNGPDTTINYNNSSNGNGVFHLDATASVKFNDTNLTAIGNTANNGGFLYLVSKEEMIFGGAVVLTHNLARNDGGAIYADGTNLTFNRALNISTNTALSGSGIYMLKGVANFNASVEISHNSAEGNGTLYFDGESKVKFNNVSLSAIGNTSAQGGGFLFFEGLGGDFSWAAASLISNSARLKGGAAYINEGNIDISGPATIKGNIGGAGGAFYIQKGNIAFADKSEIVLNKAGDLGGAVYIQEGDIKFDGQADISGNESIAGSGGAIYIQKGSLTFAQNLDLNSNSAAAGGGGLHLDEGSIQIGGAATIKENIGGAGGAIYIQKGSLTFAQNLDLNSNRSAAGGGGLHLDEGNIQIGGAATIKENIGGSGGAIYIQKGSLNFAQNLDLISNSAGTGGGGLHLDEGNIQIGGAATIKENIGGSGGAIYVGQGNISFAKDAVLGSNSAAGSGGAIYIQKGSLTFAQNLELISNSAGAGGGGLHLDEGNIQIGGAATIKGNTGGAIYIQKGSLTFAQNLDLNSNRAAAGGGGLHLDEGNIQIGGAATIKGNIGGTGGAIYIQKGSLNFAQNLELISNRSATGGGGLHLDEGNIQIGGAATIKGNIGGSGGAIYVGQGNISFAKDAVLASNSAAGSGGAIYIQKGRGIFNGSAVLNSNSALAGGGVLYGSATELEFNKGLAASENSAGAGGVFYLKDGSKLTIAGKEAVFVGNLANAEGGAVKIENSQMKILTDKGEFRANSAAQGGAVYIGHNGYFETYDTDFIDNKSSDKGGAIFLSGQGSARAEAMIHAANKDMVFDNTAGADRKAIGARSAAAAAGGIGGDIYLERYSQAVFDVAKSKKMTLNGGLSGSNVDNKVIKSGQGALIINGATDYRGSFYIDDGQLLINREAITLGKLFISSSARLVLPDFDGQESTVYTYGGKIAGTIELNANYLLAKTDRVINLDAETMTLSSTSKLIVKTYGIGKIDYVLIDGYEGGRFGSIDIPSSSNYRIVYEKDRVRFVSSARTYFSAQPNTDNQQIMAQMLDYVSWYYDGMPPEIHKLISDINQLAPSQRQEIFQQMSGTVYANVIKSLAKDKNFNYLFRQMSLYQWDKRPAAWVNVYHSDRKYKHNLDFADDFNVFGQGAIAGYDFFQIENSLITGGYLGYGDYFLKEGDYADGRIWDFEAGLYAMKALKIFEENFNVMANFAAGRQNLEIKREISVNDLSYSPHSSFYTNTLKVAFKSEYVRKVADNIRIKPFLGFEEGFVSYDNIRETDSKETELSIDEGNYLRSAVFAGVGADGEFWGFVTDLEIYGGVLISGQKARFKGKLLNSIEKIKSQEIKGAKENIYGGVSAGVNYLILDNLSVGLSVNIETGERADTFWQYYGLNAKYKFGKRQYPDVDYDYLKARQAYDKGRYIEASEILNELVASSTQSEAGAALLSEIKDMIAQDADRKSEMDYQNHAYAKAYNAYFEGEYARAIFEWKKYIEFAGEGQDVEEYLDKVTKILETQREESLTQNVEAMLNEGIARYQEKRWYDCIKKMDELQKYVMENKFSKSESYFGKAKKYIDESLKELSKGIEIPKSADLKPAVDEQPIAVNIDEEAAQEKYNEGFELYAQGKYQEAQRAWEQVLRINPNHAKAKIALLRMKEEGQLQNSN